MKTFVYRGYDREGQRCKGAVEALDIKEAREKLSRSGIFPEFLDDSAKTSRGAWFLPAPPSLRQATVRAEFFRALAALLRAGLPMAAAFEIVLDQPGQQVARAVNEMAGIRDRIRDGGGFAQSFVEVGIPLSPFELAVLESGEKTGRLSEVLDQVADYLDDIGRLRQSLLNACIYPAVIVILSLVVGFGVLGFLVPQLAEMFAESGMPLPLITRLVVGAGHWFIPVILPLAVAGALLAALGVRRLRRQPARRVRLERRLARLPLVASGFQYVVTARFARTCALLLRGGVSLVDAVGLAGRATGSVWLADILAGKAEDLRHGKSFSHALAETPVIGPALGAWVRAGEAAGDLPGMFQHAADRFRQLWSHYLQRATTLIEPLLIVLVAVFVLVVALAILLPILSLNQHLG
ncbi:MAG TPA: type II secretion system F family protein [Kiritimatiellia bacterium]|nr:type II secretion system F family protein [Kiritimatiellia bacterium]HMO98274.1 type II secretion system F family protein [Kiritimatiellia bacterium]HMP96271.1 type II secretion system F family protein [Kiritimatiellia bacterium]